MRVSVLASGSKGNASFVEMSGVRLLIDAGISARRIATELNALGVDPSELDGVLITHEHIDHVKGLSVFCRRFNVPVYSRTATLRAVTGKYELPFDVLHPVEERFSFGKVLVETCNISHDAAEPVAFRVTTGDERIAFATDLGFVSSSVQDFLEDAGVIVLEANHDIRMLKTGSYSPELKRRVLGNRGHLSNNDAAWALARLKKKPREVFLAHLSQENNLPSLAEDTVKNILRQQGVSLADIKINLTSQTSAVSL